MSIIRKRKLTKNQTRQIQKNHQTVDDKYLFSGVIVAHFGKQLDVQITALPADSSNYPKLTQPLIIGEVCRCHVRTNLPLLSAGDLVKFSLNPQDSSAGVIEILLPRSTLITRPDRYHKLKPVASNVDVLAIVFAPLPKPSTNLIDRYLLIAKLSKVTPLLILNKADLLENFADVSKIFEEYQFLGGKYGFNVIQTSYQDKQSIIELKRQINHKISVFAGQSGVGKSSLINALLPHANQSTNVISTNSELGQHTTTTSRFLAYDDADLTKGGIIDTPGIREYGVWHLSPDEILYGFDELFELSGTCQFRDCTHKANSKGCNFWKMVKNGEILSRRIDSFNELYTEAKNSKSSH